jgi:hypothetical protein
MKVFIRTNDLNEETPIVVACYDDEKAVPDDAHGAGMTVLTLPRELIESPRIELNGGMPFLAKNWRERAGTMPVEAEARRRIDDAFPVSEQLSALHDMLDAIMRHGADVSKWPEDVRHRKALFDQRWKYVSDVVSKSLEHARTAAPRDPSSDKIWPQRMAKKV